MAGTLTVQNIEGPSSGANADKVILNTGQTLYAPGHVIQVVTVSLSSDVSYSSSNLAKTNIMTLNITPKFNTSKIFVMITLGSISSAAGISVGFRLLRDSTAVGNAADTTLQSGFTNIYEGGNSSLFSASHNFLDSPSTTSAITYKLQWRNSSGTTYLNRYSGSSDSYNGSSTITAMEVSA